MTGPVRYLSTLRGKEKKKKKNLQLGKTVRLSFITLVDSPLTRAAVLLATLVGSGPWPAYRRRIITELEQLSRSLGLIFEHSVQLAQLPAWLAHRLRLPSWRGFVSTADYALDAVNALVADMERLEGIEDGLMGRMIAAGIKGDALQRIVGDLILAAGDTVSCDDFSGWVWLGFSFISNMNHMLIRQCRIWD